MTIRCQTTRDLGVIYAMDRICLPDDDPVNLHRSRWWLAKRDGETAGYAGAYVLLGDEAVYLSRAGVLPSHRGHGVQLALIRARVRWARRLAGVRVVITDTSWNNPASSNNLIRAGFRLYDPAGPWCEGHALYWRLPLDRPQVR